MSLTLLFKSKGVNFFQDKSSIEAAGRSAAGPFYLFDRVNVLTFTGENYTAKCMVRLHA